MAGLPEGTLLQEDNDPKHQSQMCCQWKEDHGIQVLPWASCSPDLNPIENLWALLNTNVDQYKLKTLKGLRQAIYKEWKMLPLDLAVHLVESMPMRPAHMIVAKGDYTCY